MIIGIEFVSCRLLLYIITIRILLLDRKEWRRRQYVDDHWIEFVGYWIVNY